MAAHLCGIGCPSCPKPFEGFSVMYTSTNERKKIYYALFQQEERNSLSSARFLSLSQVSNVEKQKLRWMEERKLGRNLRSEKVQNYPHRITRWEFIYKGFSHAFKRLPWLQEPKYTSSSPFHLSASKQTHKKHKGMAGSVKACTNCEQNRDHSKCLGQFFTTTAPVTHVTHNSLLLAVAGHAVSGMRC